ncbi:hypothetical protein Bca4012_024317 [Brassica carinata]
MKLFAFFVMFFLYLNCFAISQTLIRDSCKKGAESSDLPNFYDFCVQSLENDPQCKNATNLDELAIAATKIAASVNTNVKGIVEKIRTDKNASHGIDLLLRDCIDYYDANSDNLDDAVTDFKSHAYHDARVMLSGALSLTEQCEEGFKDSQKKSPVTKENNDLYQKMYILLQFGTMLDKKL